MTKSSLRNELRQRRSALSPVEQSIAAALLSDNFFRTGLHLRYQRIGFYWPFGGEIDPRPLVSQLLSMGKQCFLPLLHPLGYNRVYFGKYSNNVAMKANRFGIAEPQGVKIAAIWSLDLILVPLVGFDRYGNRLGMGAGFYDHSFAFLRRQSLGPKLIGLAHQCQQAESIVTEPWDIPMEGILTDEGYIGASTPSTKNLT